MVADQATYTPLTETQRHYSAMHYSQQQPVPPSSNTYSQAYERDGEFVYYLVQES